MIDAPITAFQTDAPIHSLRIIQDGFGLHADTPCLATTNGVPGAAITGDRQRDLGVPAQGRMDSSPEPLEEPRLPDVSKRVAPWIGPERNRQSERSRLADHDSQRHHRRATSLDPTNLGLGDARRRLERALTQPGPYASPAKLPSDSNQRLIGKPLRPIVRPLAGCHTPGSSDWSLYCGSPGAIAGPRHGPNLEGSRPPTAESGSYPGFGRWMAHGPVRFGSPRTLPPRLVHPTAQHQRSGSLRPRLARPTVQAGPVRAGGVR